MSVSSLFLFFYSNFTLITVDNIYHTQNVSSKRESCSSSNKMFCDWPIHYLILIHNITRLISVILYMIMLKAKAAFDYGNTGS